MIMAKLVWVGRFVEKVQVICTGMDTIVVLHTNKVTPGPALDIFGRGSVHTLQLTMP
jgi:hypothetical protein